MFVDGKEIGAQHKPYVIAELSANHGGDIERAKLSIEQAARAGVSAVKLQTYTPDTMTLPSQKPEFMVQDGLWAGRSLYDLYAEAHTPFDWHQDLFDHAKKCGVTLFSTPFDESAVDLLEDLNTPAYKIASFEVIDIPLITYVASKHKPIFMSTGMASQDEITEAVEAVRRVTEADLLLFHCVSSYPALTSDAHLSNLLWLKETLNVEIGLSDHTTTHVAALTAIGMGAVAIEKHFKLDDQDCGPDSSFSLTIEELADLVDQCTLAWQAKGSSSFGRSASEGASALFRRSLFFVKPLKAGQEITEQDIRRIRPGHGLPPKHFDEIIGMRTTRDIDIGEPVIWDLVEKTYG